MLSSMLQRPLCFQPLVRACLLVTVLLCAIAQADIILAEDGPDYFCQPQVGYDPYGKVTVLAADGTTVRAASSYGNSLTFTGRRLDSETGLYYFRARYYSSELGRFIGRDPLGYVDGMSMYAGYYVPNGVDPYGLYDWGDFVNDATEVALTAMNLKVMAAHAVADAASAIYEGTPAYFGTSAGREEGIKALRDNGIRQAYDREQEHLHDTIDLHDRRKDAWAATDTVATMLSDVSGATDIYEGGAGFDTTDYAKTGNQVELEGIDRASRVFKGVGQVAGNAALVGGIVDSAMGRVPAPSTNSQSCKYNGVNCFTGDTKVLMADGTTKVIEEVEIGDEVLADDPEDSIPAGTFKVLAVKRSRTERLFHIILDESSEDVNEIKSTGKHPFWTKTGWKLVEDLSPADSLLNVKGQWIEINGIWIEKTHTATYNLTVANTHTFFVTVGGFSVLVHNDPPSGPRPPVKPAVTTLPTPKPPYSATFGSSTTTAYRDTFLTANPNVGDVWVHHAVERQVLKNYPGVITESEMHSLENLRGIPADINSDLHLSKIRMEWNEWYENNPSATKADFLKKATEIDMKYGNKFEPPLECK